MNLEEVHWYYIDELNGDLQVGPFPIKDFKEKFLSGVFTPETYCWHEEIETWQKLKTITFRNKPALHYFVETPPAPDFTLKPPVVSENRSISPNKTLSIEEEIKERLRKKFANK